MAKAKIWCEVVCGCCGDMAAGSGLYHNKLNIAILKDAIKDWKYTEEYGNTCPKCLKKMKEKKEM